MKMLCICIASTLGAAGLAFSLAIFRAFLITHPSDASPQGIFVVCSITATLFLGSIAFSLLAVHARKEGL